MRVLMVLSGASEIKCADGKVYPTGYWLEEFVVPYRELESWGCKIQVATPHGNVPTPDPESTAVDSAGVCKNWEQPEKFSDGLALHDLLAKEDGIRSLADISPGELATFHGVFFPGGYAPMVDLGNCEHTGAVLNYFHEHQKPTALFCHGPVALLSARSDSAFTYRGYRMTCFSTAEEQDTPLGRSLGSTVEDMLVEAGGEYERGDKWTSHVVVDRELITGQNTQSTQSVTDTFRAAIGA